MRPSRALNTSRRHRRSHCLGARYVKDEEKAIAMYKQIIEMARKEGDETTAFIFMEILKDEEDHHDTFTTLLEQV